MKITSFRDIPQFTRDGSYQVDFDLEGLTRWIESEEEMGLQLNPKFQRGHIWTEEQQITFIEYYLRGGNSGRILYFNSPSWHRSVPEGAYNEYVCVDGLQRITAIQKFINNEIKVFGSYFEEYKDKIRISSHTMKVNVNDLKTEKEVLQWYIDINAGGTPHTKEEIEKVEKIIKELD